MHHIVCFVFSIRWKIMHHLRQREKTTQIHMYTCTQSHTLTHLLSQRDRKHEKKTKTKEKACKHCNMHTSTYFATNDSVWLCIHMYSYALYIRNMAVTLLFTPTHVYAMHHTLTHSHTYTHAHTLK